MSLLSRLFGGGGQKPPSPEPVEYEGYRILPEPIPADGQFRLAAWIELDVDGATKRHHLIRADLLRDRAEAEQAAINKARQLIDQQGALLFG